MTTSPPIGRVKGPGEKAYEYTLITADTVQTKIGEFVYYETALDGHVVPILGKVIHRRLVRGLPDAFLTDARIAPQAIAGVIGLHSPDAQLFEVVVSITGFFDPQLRDFINPRIPPAPGTAVYLAPNAMLVGVLNARLPKSRGSAHVGSLLSRPSGDVPVVIDVKAMVSTHLAILASTGAGKSYTAGVLIEELMKPYNRAAVLIVDPHGEYHTLKDTLENHPDFHEGSYRPQVAIFHEDKVKVRTSTLTYGDLCYLLPDLSEKMRFYLKKAHSEVKDAARRLGRAHSWGAAELLNAVEGLQDGRGEGDDTGKSSRDGLRWRLSSSLENSSLFDSHRHLDLNELFQPGRVSVLQIHELDQRDQQIMVSTILRRVNKARIDTLRGNVQPGDENHLDYPVFVLMEEAHRFAPANAEVATTQILKTILAEGRKFGVGIGLITQRPGKLDGDVLSQCMTQMIMRIVNPIDQGSIAASVESAGRDLLDELPALSKGQVIIAGAAVNTPVLVRVRARLSHHGGETVDAPAAWADYFSIGAESGRDQAEALLVDPSQPQAYFEGFPV
ncbi:MAG: ATP-binding protein [Candidatus Sericytochromatia bacterium]|nr:ATP-binding protein [Candidatus Sericytochromatia bacterium]